MSSLEIADLTGKRHDNVLSDIRKMLEELGKTSPEFSGNVPDSYGRPRFVFNLPKRETMILVSGYSITLRAKIVDRWQELEAQVLAAKPALPDFTDPVAAARAWANEYEGRQIEAQRAEQAERLLGEARPKVEVYDQIADGSGSFNFTTVAKMLEIGRHKSDDGGAGMRRRSWILGQYLSISSVFWSLSSPSQGSGMLIPV